MHWASKSVGGAVGDSSRSRSQEEEVFRVMWLHVPPLVTIATAWVTKLGPVAVLHGI